MNQNNPPDVADLINRNAELKSECYQARCKRNMLGHERNLWLLKRDSLLRQRDWLLNDKNKLISRNIKLAHITDDLHSQIKALDHRLFSHLPVSPAQNAAPPAQAAPPQNAPPPPPQAVVRSIPTAANGLGNTAAAPVVVIDVEDDGDGEEQ